jgi:hypothetical protein
MSKECYTSLGKIGRICFDAGLSNTLTYIPNQATLSVTAVGTSIYGSPTFNGLVASGFSTSNYLGIPIIAPFFAPLNWEFVIKATTGNSLSNNQGLFGITGTGIIRGDIQSNKLKVQLSTNTSNFDIGSINSSTLSTNTTYWFRLSASYSSSDPDSRTGNLIITLETSTDGTNFTNNGSATLSGVSTTGTKAFYFPTPELLIGKARDGVWGGSIDLSASYLKYGQVNWSGKSGVTLKSGSKIYIPNGWSDYTYYKSTFGSWTQPTLTSNTSNSSFTISDPKLSGGTISGTTMTWGSSAITNTSDVWKAFDSSTSTYFTINKGNQTFTVFDINFSNYMSISGVTITGNIVSGAASALTGSQIYSINDIGNPTLISTLTTSNVNTHTFTGTRTKKLRICVRPNTDGSSYPTRITNIAITGQVETSTTTSTSSSYDYKVGSGTKLFTEVTTTSNLSNSSVYANKNLIISNGSGNIHWSMYHNSGDTPPSSPVSATIWYNTNENIVYRYDGIKWVGGYSLPIGIVNPNASSSEILSEVKTFKGIGYVGSTIYVFPGLKALIPNGLKENYTYNSTEYEVTKIQPLTFTGNPGATSLFLRNNGTLVERYYKKQSYQPNRTYCAWYNPHTNTYKECGSDASNFTNKSMVYIGSFSDDNGSPVKITSASLNSIQTKNERLNIKSVYKGSQQVWGYTPSQILFESSTTGTYTLNIEHSGAYELTICGAGGGGGGSATAHSWYGSNGGSGAAFKGVVNLTPGTYTLVVGQGGNGGGASGRNAPGGSNGTASTISKDSTTIISAGAGNGGHGTGDYGSSNNGNGGTLTLGSIEVISSTISSNGVTKSTASVLENGYGGGGSFVSRSAGTKGQNGYIKLVAK